MNEFVRQAAGVLYDVWQRRWIALGVAWLAAVLGGAIVFIVKDRYEATAQIYVDTQTVLKPLMAGLAFQPDIDQQVRMLARTLVSRPNVEKLVDNRDIGLMPPEGSQRERVINSLMTKIRVTPSGGGNLYTISYRDTEGERAHRVVENLVNLFVEASIGGKKRDSQEASRFIDEQIEEYEGKLIEAENRLKDFKLRNFGVSGMSNQDYFARMSALADEVSRLRMELDAAERSRDALKRELNSEEPQLPPEAMLPATGPVVSELDARLDSQRRQLDDLLRRYTEDHPDVISARRTIASIEQQKKLEAEARASRGAGKPVAATNPVFQRLRVALAEAEAKVAALRGQLNAQESRLQQIRSVAGRVPQVEAELAQLNRDYDVIRKNYEQLVARREAASLGVKIDQSSQLTDFRMVEPARVSPSPVFPSRKVLALLVVLAAAGVGCAAAFALTRLYPSFGDEKTLRELTRRPVLGSVAVVLTPERSMLERRQRLQFAGATGVFLLVNMAWVGWVALHGQI
ncbi:XrtA system polysaccharide chain length determinant [Caldimonas brevitalea]|uniref:Lipopolysaccharide biosynthesis chain length determinant protein n=1 Tax=Caldimonas brevitalea TaxID=413882 RepID=A0A0G3BPJ5_9BURK|nr:XrtA system polysaccharide chain length determinant [Caldimonas brevitalea]AKJ29908.1 lipopolysaccharide biosynthesis chain length determinant protein [Caldimonas brevitalea]